MLDKARLTGCCSVIKDHHVIDFKLRYGFQVMSNSQEHCGFQVFAMNFKQ